MRLARLLLPLLLAVWALPAAAQNVENGRALYNSLCLSCHGFPPAGGPDRAVDDPSLITRAVSGRVPTMSFLGGILSVQDINDIAAYLRSLTNPAPPVPAFDYTDLWWNEAESGWGLNLIQHASHVIFGVMYTYDANRKATWLVMPGGTWSSATSYSGTLYRVAGPPFNLSTFDPTRVRVTAVGTATLAFSGRDNATFTFSVDGTQVTKALTRQPF